MLDVDDAEAVLGKLLAEYNRENCNGSAAETELAERAASPELKKLAAPVMMARTTERALLEDLSMLGLVRNKVNFNREIKIWNNGEMTGDDESSQRMRFKAEKRQVKAEKRGIMRERMAADKRQELMDRITRLPVVIHNSEDVGLSGCVDIHLENFNVDIGGLSLLEDCDLTLAASMNSKGLAPYLTALLGMPPVSKDWQSLTTGIGFDAYEAFDV